MDIERKSIEITEICRVEGHAAVTVNFEDGVIADVQLNVFEGARFFERIVLGHKYDEIAHITSRVCAICSTGHVVAALKSIEGIFGFVPDQRDLWHRELMHLGMIIESHATHICALALPDFLNVGDLMTLAGQHPAEFEIWKQLRSLGSTIQTIVGGRPFHPVNLHVGGLSSYPDKEQLLEMHKLLDENQDNAMRLYSLLAGLDVSFGQGAAPVYSALIPAQDGYGYFGEVIKTSTNFQANVDEYRHYLNEKVVRYSHAKQSTFEGQPFMVGSLARLYMFAERLRPTALALYEKSPLASKAHNTILNNLAQAIELVEAIDRAKVVIETLLASNPGDSNSKFIHQTATLEKKTGAKTGAVECPRGTLYHYYELDDSGKVIAADMITPSAQNTARIESDIRQLVAGLKEDQTDAIQAKLETLVRAYDPCNTCATHMVQVNYR